MSARVVPRRGGDGWASEADLPPAWAVLATRREPPMPADADYEHYRSIAKGVPCPALFVDLDRFDRNAQALVVRAGRLPIRVASKSVRCVALLERVLSRRGYRGVLAYRAAEAAFLAARGLDDLLVAYPTVERGELDAVARAVAEGKTIRLMVDDPAQLEAIDAAAKLASVALEVVIDLDMSSALPGLWFGVRRSPIHGPQDALRLAKAIERRASLRLVGVMGYEAQIAGLADAGQSSRLVGGVLSALKARSLPEIIERRVKTVQALRVAGFPIELVNGGGTGSLEPSREDPSLTELAAGSGLYSPALFDGYRQFRHEAAMMFALTITRRPAPGMLTCHGGGFAASGAPGWDRLPLPTLPVGAALSKREGAGEVQTPIHYTGPVSLGIGDPVFFRHAKAGEACEHFREIHLISGGRIVDTVPTYRGDGQAF